MRHDVVEVVSSNEAVVVQVCLSEDSLQFLRRQILSQLFCHLSEFMHADPPLNQIIFTTRL